MEDDRVVGRARWAQAFVIASGSAQAAFVFSAPLDMYGLVKSLDGGGVVVMLFGLAAIVVGATITAVVLHVLLVGDARAAVQRHAEAGAVRVG